MDKITIIVPCYNEEAGIDFFYPEVQKHVEKIPDCEFFYLFVNDGSRDGTLEKLISKRFIFEFVSKFRQRISNDGGY